jgi:predicted dehydrogenase
MVNVGIVGIGFMGMIHYLAYQKVRGARVAAICTRDRKKLRGDWRGIKGNFGPRGTRMELGKIAAYEDWQELINDPKIDVVDICLPPAMHAEVAIAALKAGKHVFCEKPIAVAEADAQRMVAAAKWARRQLTIGHVLPFMPVYDFAQRAILSGKYGKLLGGRFERVISDPLWLADFYDARLVGGPVVDLHIHDAHFIRLVCGMPRAVFSTGRTRGDVVSFVTTQFIFDRDDLSMSAASGVIDQQGRSFSHGFEIYLERATLSYRSSVIEDKPVDEVPLVVLTADGKAQRPKLREVDSFVAELAEVVRTVRTGRPSDLLGGELARDALVLCHKQQDSVRRQKIVRV